MLWHRHAATRAGGEIRERLLRGALKAKREREDDWEQIFFKRRPSPDPNYNKEALSAIASELLFFY